MKSLIDCINESVLPTPELGMGCIGVDGGKYKVVDYCYSNEKEAMRKMCKKWDSSGAVLDDLSRGNLPRKCIVVALQDDEDGTTSVWLWTKEWIKEADM